MTPRQSNLNDEVFHSLNLFETFSFFVLPFLLALLKYGLFLPRQSTSSFGLSFAAVTFVKTIRSLMHGAEPDRLQMKCLNCEWLH